MDTAILEKQAWPNQRLDNNYIYLFLITSLIVSYVFVYGYWLNRAVASNSLEIFKDTGYWIEASNFLNKDQNPYVNQELYKSGIFSASIIGLIQFFPIPMELNLLIFQIFSTLGLLGFVFTVLPSNKTKSALIFCVILFSSTREIFVNNQLTGILVGAFSVCLYILKLMDSDSSKLNRTKVYLAQTLTGLLMIFLLDAKVNIFLFPVLFVVVKYKGIKPFLIGLLVWTSHQVYYSLKVGDVLLLSWFETLGETSNYETNPNLYGSLGFWQIVNNFSQNELLFTYGPPIAFLTLGFFALTFARSNNIILPLSLSFLTNYFYTYFHYYSYFPILTMLMYAIFLHTSPFLVGFVLSTMFISFNIFNSSILLSFAAMVVFMTLYTFRSKKNDLLFVFGWSASLFSRFLFLSEFENNDYFKKSIIVSVPILALIVSVLLERVLQKIKITSLRVF